MDAAGTATFTWDNANSLATAMDPVTGRTSTYGYDDADRLTRITATSPTTHPDLRLRRHQPTQRPHAEEQHRHPTRQDHLRVGQRRQPHHARPPQARPGQAPTPTATTTPVASRRGPPPAAPSPPTHGTRPATASKPATKTYTYDERNRLTSGDGTDYTYTPRGTLASQTKDGTVTNLTFDAFDRLIADGEATYSYDSLGRITTRTRGVQVDKFRYTGVTNKLAAITNTVGATQARYGRDPFGHCSDSRGATVPPSA